MAFQLDAKDDIIAEATYRLTEIENIFKLTRRFSSGFNTHIAAMDRLVKSLLETSDEPVVVEQINEGEYHAKHRLTFQGPGGFLAMRHSSMGKQHNDSKLIKEEVTEENIIDATDDAHHNFFSDSRRISKDSKGGDLDDFRNIFRMNHSQNASNLIEVDINAMGGDNFESSFKNRPITPGNNGLTIGFESERNQQYESLKDQNKVYGSMLAAGEESSRVIKTLLDQIAAQKSESQSTDELKAKYNKLKTKYDKLKIEYKGLEKENTELRITATVVKNNNEEVVKMSEKMKSSFLTNNLERSTEIANMDNYKRKIESQSIKINMLVDERDNLSLLLDTANTRLAFLEQDVRNMRNEFIDLYKTIYDQIQTPMSSRTLRMTDSNEFEPISMQVARDNLTSNDSHYRKSELKQEIWEMDPTIKKKGSTHRTELLRQSMQLQNNRHKSKVPNSNSLRGIEYQGLRSNPSGSLNDNKHNGTGESPLDLQRFSENNFDQIDNIVESDEVYMQEEIYEFEHKNSDFLAAQDNDQDFLISDDKEVPEVRDRRFSDKQAEVRIGNSFLKNKTKSLANTTTCLGGLLDGKKPQYESAKITVTTKKRDSLMNVFRNLELEEDNEEAGSDIVEEPDDDKQIAGEKVESLQDDKDKDSKKSENSYSLVQIEQSNRNSLDLNTKNSSKKEIESDKKNTEFDPNQFFQTGDYFNEDENPNSAFKRMGRSSKRSSSLERFGYPSNGETSNFYTFSNNHTPEIN